MKPHGLKRKPSNNPAGRSKGTTKEKTRVVYKRVPVAIYDQCIEAVLKMVSEYKQK